MWKSTPMQRRTIEIINCCSCFVTSHCEKLKLLLLLLHVCSGKYMRWNAHAICAAILNWASESYHLFEYFNFIACSFLDFIHSFMSFTLRATASSWLASLQRIRQRRHFWDNRRMHKYIYVFIFSSVLIERRTNPHTHTTTRHHQPHNRIPNARRLRLLFNEPKRMNAFGTKFGSNEQNKIEINVFLCCEPES